MAIKFFAYISRICRETPLEQIYMKFRVRGHLADVINRAKFYLNRVRGFDSVGVEFLAFSYKEKLLLSQGLNYRSACDTTTYEKRSISFRTVLLCKHIVTAKNQNYYELNATGSNRLVEQWEHCSELQREYVEK